MNHKALTACLALVAVLIAAPFAAATAQTMDQRVEHLEKMIEGLQEQLLQARGELNKMMAKRKGKRKDKKGGVVRTDGEDVRLSTTGGGFKLKSDNGNSFQLGGRIMYDYDFFDGVFTNNDEEQSEGEFRRTRLTAKGSVKKDWKYLLTVNIDDQDESADINTAYVEYAGFKPFAIRVGKFKEPFSLERLTSSKWLSTIERNVMLDFLGGNLGSGQPDLGGVQVSGYHEEMNHLNWALGVFDDGSEDGDGEDNYAVTGRVALAPHFSDDHFLHLGAAYSVRNVEDRVRYLSRLGVHTAADVRPTFADAWIDDVDQWGLETAYVRGPFSLQAEYMDVSADGDTAPSLDDSGACNDGAQTPILVKCGDIDFDGYYVQAAYTLTGETRGYKTKGAVFGKIKPAGSLGAWEIVARYEDVEVDNDNYKGDVADGRKLEAEKLVLGVNWYANANVKFMLNYIDAEVDDELAQGDGDDDDGEAWSLRAQYAF